MAGALRSPLNALAISQSTVLGTKIQWSVTDFALVPLMLLLLLIGKSCPTFCDPMGCSTPNLPVLHYLLEFAQTRVHWIGDAIQPSHPLMRVQFSSVASCMRLFAAPWIAARQASLSITISWSSLKLKSIELVMPSSHLVLCPPLFLLPPIPPSITVFSNE